MDEELYIKTLFAEFIVKFKFDVDKAAKEVCRVCEIKPEHWKDIISFYRYNPDVVRKIEEFELLEKEQINELPTKQEILKKLWEVANNKRIDPKEQVNAMKLYSEIQTWTKGSKVEVSSVPKVMIVKEKASNEDEWERLANKQQQDLCKN